LYFSVITTTYYSSVVRRNGQWNIIVLQFTSLGKCVSIEVLESVKDKTVITLLFYLYLLLYFSIFYFYENRKSGIFQKTKNIL